VVVRPVSSVRRRGAVHGYVRNDFRSERSPWGDGDRRRAGLVSLPEPGVLRDLWDPPQVAIWIALSHVSLKVPSEQSATRLPFLRGKECCRIVPATQCGHGARYIAGGGSTLVESKSVEGDNTEGAGRKSSVPTIVLADDHAVVRQGLRGLLENEPDFTVVGEAGSGLEAIRLVSDLKPEVLVLDVMMDDISGIEVARQVKDLSPGTAVIILSMYSGKGHIVKALQAGARGYVVKKAAAEELVQAVREVAAGRRYLGGPVSDIVVDAFLEKMETAESDPYDSLSSREREVLQLAAHGYTNAEIAERLFISRRTVETHRANAMRKLGLRTQIDLLRYALQRGILPLDI